ncbi:MAG: hypothetical protein JNL05_00520 [Flavobacteriales bacterium]|nr:hypothetical protein [Flavobacteriales bacterium]
MKRQVERVHYNGPQLEAMLVRAQEEYHVAGRGAGKTDGILAERLEYNAFAMPRSMGGMIGPSYYKMLTQFLPKIRKGLERLGYTEGLHYFVGSRAPKAWRWEIPISAPFRWDTTIHLKCGSGVQLISQDRPTSSSGVDLDYLLGDEARYLKYKMMEEETFPAIRGNHGRFGHLSVYGSMVFTTDRPRTPGGRWILEKRERMDQRVIETIKSASLEIWKMRTAIRTERLAESTVREYGVRIRRFEELLNHLRKGTVYYKEWSALDNIHVLGYEYLRKEKERLSDYEFRISILNEPIDRVEGGFYPELDEEKHTYEAHAIDYIEKVRDQWEKLENRDCRHDARLVKTLPIDIAFDYGFSFNCCVIGQLFGDRYSVDNCLYVKAPMKIRHLVDKFHDYYQWHGTRDINFFYDHTAIGGDASREYTFSEEIIRELTSKGWKVNPVYIGQAPAHHDKYLFWSKLLGSTEEVLHQEGLPKVEFNADNCEPLLLSMSLAPARQLKNRFEKDKTSEGREGDQAEATHLSDAGDTLMWGRLNIGGEDVPMPLGSVYGAR